MPVKNILLSKHRTVAPDSTPNTSLLIASPW